MLLLLLLLLLALPWPGPLQPPFPAATLLVWSISAAETPRGLSALQRMNLLLLLLLRLPICLAAGGPT